MFGFYRVSRFGVSFHKAHRFIKSLVRIILGSYMIYIAAVFGIGVDEQFVD